VVGVVDARIVEPYSLRAVTERLNRKTIQAATPIPFDDDRVARGSETRVKRARALWEGPRSDQLVGGVMAHQGYDR
jgi:hypothetical protein